MDEKLKQKIFALSRTDRIRLANDLWDSFFLGNVRLSSSQLKFLQRRLTKYLNDGVTFMSPDEIQKKLKRVKAELSKKKSSVRRVKA
jgi:putative addiction module component (TIGR02574 family)